MAHSRFQLGAMIWTQCQVLAALKGKGAFS